MSQASQIRITKTPEIQKVLDILHLQYPLLSDAEIIKVTLSQYTYQQNTNIKTGKNLVKFMQNNRQNPYSNGQYSQSYKEIYYSNLDKKYAK